MTILETALAKRSRRLKLTSMRLQTPMNMHHGPMRRQIAWSALMCHLALPHRRILLAWMTIDALVWVPRMYYLYGEQNKGLPEQWFTATVLLRDIAVVVLMALVVRQIYRPELDLVRWDGRVDDPSGGVFDGVPDAHPAWLPRWLRPRGAVTEKVTEKGV